MRSLKISFLPLLAAALLVGCGGEEAAGTDISKSGGEEQRMDTAFPTSEPEAAEGQRLPEEIEERLQTLDVRTWQDIAGNGIPEEEARLNSAKENLGYLTWSGNGETVYYSDLSADKIYACKAEGEEKTCLYESAGLYLQVKDGWLYAWINDGKKIVRIHCETGESEDVFTEPCGEFFFLKDKLYLNTPEGLCIYNEEDGGRTYCGSEFEVTNIQLCQDIILANVINDEDVTFFTKGYLLGYDTAEEQYFLVKKNALWPVAAGDWLSFFDMETRTRHVLDRVTGEEEDMGVYAQYVACDGAKLYYQDGDGQIYCWDGQTSAALLSAEGSVQYIYLTPAYLYWMQTDNTWWYYDLESGKSGSL
ncbi:MAG: DUF5050 domain-containing protein [Butyrivibrio sp.]|nr:DUF5050 domain-containing protein [Acetatifactor muris]MCM1558083.1 DUF5050 domain-containing protein [Butyrivibrio sp.]MCM1560446.1 DUF5050 domain-containing protein [Butyrivibrio sp.]